MMYGIRNTFRRPFQFREFIEQAVGIAGDYFFNVVLLGGTPGAYLADFPLARPVRGREYGGPG